MDALQHVIEKLWEVLVPYKSLWRTGAGKCSTISFDQEVIINNKKIPAGIYAIVSIPDEKEWIVMLNTDTSKVYGAPYEYDSKTEAVRLNVTSEKTNRFYESLTIALDIARHDAIFMLSWENTMIQFPIVTQSHQKALAEIANALEQKPNDQSLLSNAAYYYYMNNESRQQILQWLDKALAIEEDRWIYHQKFDVLERMKKYDEARKTANTAIAFLNRTKPEHWEDGVRSLEERMKKWSSK